MNWDDLRYVLAVARQRTLAGAGRELSRHQLVVLRRMTKRRAQLNRADRLLWVWLSRSWKEWRVLVTLIAL